MTNRYTPLTKRYTSVLLGCHLNLNPFLTFLLSRHFIGTKTARRVEALEDLAYILYRYRETFTELETGNIKIDVMHSAIMISPEKMQEWMENKRKEFKGLPNE